jgi:hypothetical protein
MLPVRRLLHKTLDPTLAHSGVVPMREQQSQIEVAVGGLGRAKAAIARELDLALAKPQVALQVRLELSLQASPASLWTSHKCSPRPSMRA